MSSIENAGGAASRGPSKAAAEKAFQFKLDMDSTRERFSSRQQEIKTEMADLLEKERVGRAMLERITDAKTKEKLAEVGRQQEAEWRKQLVALREELADIERSMAAKNIKPEGQSLN
jgi:hypothetical protein